MMDTTSWLRQVEYFSVLLDDVGEVARHVHVRHFSAGQVIMLEGEVCEGLYVVKAGRARIYKMSPSGREQVLRVIPLGESFNDVPVFDGGSNPASADCLDDVEIGILTKPDAEQLLRRLTGRTPAWLPETCRHSPKLIQDYHRCARSPSAYSGSKANCRLLLSS